jgi:hypothetical protein
MFLAEICVYQSGLQYASSHANDSDGSKYLTHDQMVSVLETEAAINAPALPGAGISRDILLHDSLTKTIVQQRTCCARYFIRYPQAVNEETAPLMCSGWIGDSFGVLSSMIPHEQRAVGVASWCASTTILLIHVIWVCLICVPFAAK